MLRINNRITAFLLVLFLLVHVLPRPQAAQEKGLITEQMIAADGNIRTALVAPTRYLNLSANDYVAKFDDLEINHCVYTARYFSSGTGEINLRCVLRSTGSTEYTTRYVRLHLYKSYNGGTWTYQQTRAIRTSSTAETTSLVEFPNLELDAFYYIVMENGTIGDSTDNYNVSGVFYISE